MARYKISCDLNHIQDMVNELERYKQWLLNDACREIALSLSQSGERTADSSYNKATGADKSHVISHDVVSVANGTAKVHFTLNGKDVMFVEFGAGIHYNGPVGETPHEPLGENTISVPTTIGSYPSRYRDRHGHSLGRLDSWHYMGKVTHGTKATMPMQNAIKAIKRGAKSSVKKVMVSRGK